MQAIGGAEVVRALIIPNLKEYEGLVREALEAMDDARRKEGEMVIEAIMEALLALEGETVGAVNGFANGHAAEMKQKLDEKIGSLFADRILETGKPRLLRAVMEC